MFQLKSPTNSSCALCHGSDKELEICFDNVSITLCNYCLLRVVSELSFYITAKENWKKKGNVKSLPRFVKPTPKKEGVKEKEVYMYSNGSIIKLGTLRKARKKLEWKEETNTSKQDNISERTN